MQWFLAVHASIPFIAMLRKAVIMPKIAIACTIACAIAGQAMGARMERDRLARVAAAAGGGLVVVSPCKDLARLEGSAQREKGRKAAATQPDGVGKALKGTNRQREALQCGDARLLPLAADLGHVAMDWWMEPPIAAMGALQKVLGRPHDSAVPVH